MISSTKLSKMSLNLSEKPEDYMSSLRKNLIMYLSEKELTLHELAELSDLNYDTLRNMIYGTSNDCKLSMVVKLARVLNISVDELVGCGTVGREYLSSMQKLRLFPDHLRYYMFWSVNTLFDGYNRNAKKEIPIKRLRQDDNGSLHIEHELTLYDISDLSADMRAKVFVAINIPCDAYMPFYSPYDVLLIANDRKPNFREHSVIVYGGCVWIAKRVEEMVDGELKVNYYSIRDGKFRTTQSDIDFEIGYIAKKVTKGE